MGNLASAINKKFGSFDAFKEKFTAAATTRFGSGWAWLVKKGQDVDVISLPNQGQPDHGWGVFQIVGLDVWEHAYYLKYQNWRPDYIGAWWNVVNWKIAEDRFNRAAVNPRQPFQGKKQKPTARRPWAFLHQCFFASPAGLCTSGRMEARTAAWAFSALPSFTAFTSYIPPLLVLFWLSAARPLILCRGRA